MYPLEIRKKAIFLYYQLNSFRKVSKIIKVPSCSIFRWVKDKSKYLLESNKFTRVRKITTSIKDFIISTITNSPLLTAKDIVKSVYNNFNLILSETTVLKFFKKECITYKKISKKYYYKDLNLLLEQKTQFSKTLSNICSKDIISIDETYFYNNMTNNYGWSKKGSKITTYLPVKKNKLSVLVAISDSKIIKSQIFSKNVSSSDFITFIKNLNVKNKYLLMDNVSFHKSKEIRDTVKNNNNLLLFIPPYSPEFNPIELFFSNLKRKCKKDYYKIIDLKKYLTGLFENSFDVLNFKKYFGTIYKTSLRLS